MACAAYSKNNPTGISIPALVQGEVCGREKHPSPQAAIFNNIEKMLRKNNDNVIVLRKKITKMFVNAWSFKKLF